MLRSQIKTTMARSRLVKLVEGVNVRAFLFELEKGRVAGRS